MIWEPFLLALAFGLVVSAAIYFVVMWPQVEPDDPAPRLGALEDSRPRSGRAGADHGRVAN